ncbi:MAG: hypothetical protein LBU82_04930 [Treponema sp.]|jgi:hypothetical protein|nr:hypothetical protein [Treponema sp.]
MALSDSKLKGELLKVYKQMWKAADTAPKNESWYAGQIAKIIDDQIKTGDVQTGIPVSVTGTATKQEGTTTGLGKIK